MYDRNMTMLAECYLLLDCGAKSVHMAAKMILTDGGWVCVGQIPRCYYWVSRTEVGEPEKV